MKQKKKMDGSKKVYTVTDLGGGDGGKGGVINKLCSLPKKPKYIIKVGGAQGSHGVLTSKGESFNFSQFGCGTFEGVKTFISKNFVSSPIGLLNEANTLRYENGVHDVFNLLLVDEDTLCSTPYHGIASRLKELSLKDNPRSIVGTGTGEAFFDQALYQDHAIYMRDLRDVSKLKNKLQIVHDQKVEEVKNLDFLDKDSALVQEELSKLYSSDFLDWTLEQFQNLSKKLNIVPSDFLKNDILDKDGICIIESSHGVLTDYLYGLQPHVTKLRTLPQITSWSMLKECDYSGEIVRLGVTRAYQIKHGSGPFVSEDKDMTKALFQKELENVDRFRGDIRIGALDITMLKYSIDLCSFKGKSFDAICLTWFDSMIKLGEWNICESYKNFDNKFFSEDGKILISEKLNKDEQIQYQKALTQSLFDCIPVPRKVNLNKNLNQNELINLVQDVLDNYLAIPVRMLGLGPTEKDKILF